MFLHRPIAVLMSFLALLIFSALALRDLPVSLLPNIDVPRIQVRVRYPNASPLAIEQNLLAPMRTRMLTLGHLKDLQSTASNGEGHLNLEFDFKASMDLAYIEVNEQVDQLMGQLPRGVERPSVLRSSSGDLPIIRLQVLRSPEGQGLSDVDLGVVGEKVIKKRLEGIEGVSVVDINGVQRPAFEVIPDRDRLLALGLSENDLWAAIRSQNQRLDAVSVRKGHYRYFLRLSNELNSLKDLKEVSIRIPEQSGQVNQDSPSQNQSWPLEALAEVRESSAPTQSVHLYNKDSSNNPNKPAIAIHLHKQENAQLGSLMEEINKVIEELRGEHPYLTFETTQNQGALLDASLGNLGSALLLGGGFAFAVLFAFMGQWRLSLLIGISLPSSLMLSFLIFGAVGLSINILSVGGLALGLGMLIDNAIIVLDNITRNLQERRQQGEAPQRALYHACSQGLRQVVAPLLSSVLTTLSVFVPLVFLDGLSGAFFYDQALAVAAILASSLAVAFVLLPLCYFLLIGAKQSAQQTVASDTWIFRQALSAYKYVYRLLMARPIGSLVLLLLPIPLLIWLLAQLPVAPLPDLTRTDGRVFLQWNEPISFEAHERRCRELWKNAGVSPQESTWDIGLPQWILPQPRRQTLLSATAYWSFASKRDLLQAERQLRDWMKQHYPEATLELEPAPTAFTQLFQSDGPWLEARFFNRSNNQPIPAEEIHRIMSALPDSAYRLGSSMSLETTAQMSIREEALQAYGIPYTQVWQRLQSLFGQTPRDEVRLFGQTIPIYGQQAQEFRKQLSKVYLSGSAGTPDIPLSSLVSLTFDTDYQTINANGRGIYQSVELLEGEGKAWEVTAMGKLKEELPSHIGVSFAGSYFRGEAQSRQLLYLLLVSVGLLYFILAAQFESFLQPLLVLLTLPLGLAGGLLFLYLSGESLNLVSGIGLVVMLGVMVNDAILKVDTINRYRRQLGLELDQALSLAGQHRLKPILMTTVTTVLALLPVLFSQGLGAELQQPLALAVIGGLLVGTFLALYLIPLAYRATTLKNKPTDTCPVTHNP